MIERTAAPADSAANGISSRYTCRASSVNQPEDPPRRLSGYTFKIANTAGTVIVVALERSAHANSATALQYRAAARGPSTARRYTRMLDIAKNADSTSRRSVAHATDSTRNGWSANNSAAVAAPRVT